MRHWPTIIVLQAQIFMLAISVIALAEHRPELRWMEGYTGRNNQSCCSQLDCLETPIALIPRPARQGHVWVQVAGASLELPISWVHESEDTHAYWCCLEPQMQSYMGKELPCMLGPPSRDNTRCVFYAVGW